MKIIEPSVELLAMTPEPLRLIERAGRVCYKSENKITEDSAEEFVSRLIARGHESVLEHASATLLIVCDRGVSHELVRHRLASFSQESTRYCRYNNDIAVIRSICFDNPSLLWIQAMKECEETYLQMLEQGVSPEMARSVLPNSLKTELVMTANFREWRHIFKLRCSKAAHPQMRQVMTMARALLRKHVPVVFDREIRDE